MKKFTTTLALAATLTLGGCAGIESAVPAAAPKATTSQSPSPSATTTSPSATPTTTPSLSVEDREAICDVYDESDFEYYQNDCDELPSASPSAEPVTFNPTKKDFKITVKVREKKCFGSAGCNITYRINPDYVGDVEFPDTGETEVFYKIRGAEDPIENYFTVDSEGSAHFDSEETASTASSGDTLT